MSLANPEGSRHAARSRAKSKAQQQAAGAALSAELGGTKPAEVVGASRAMYGTMTGKELEDLASTSHEGLPEHVPDD